MLNRSGTDHTEPARLIKTEDSRKTVTSNNNHVTPEGSVFVNLENNQELNNFNKSMSYRNEHRSMHGINVMEKAKKSGLMASLEKSSKNFDKENCNINEYLSYRAENQSFDVLNVKPGRDFGVSFKQNYTHSEDRIYESEKPGELSNILEAEGLKSLYLSSQPNHEEEDKEDKEDLEKLMSKSVVSKNTENSNIGSESEVDAVLDEKLEKSDEISKREAVLYKERGDRFLHLMQDDIKALKYYEKACRLDPTNYDFHLSKANILKRLGKNEKAIACCDQMIAIGKTGPDIYAVKGSLVNGLARRKEAEECFKKALNSDAEFDNLANKVLAEAELGETDYALQISERAISSDLSDADYLFSKAVVLYKQEKYEEALECQNRVINIDENYLTAKIWKGYILNDLGRHQEALEVVNQAIIQNPENQNLYINKGWALHDMGQTRSAIANYTKAIILCPQDSLAYNNRADALNRIGERTKALVDAEKAISLAPENNLRYCTKGDILLDLGRTEEALECFNKALSLKRNVYNLFFRGKCLNQCGRTEDARKDFQEVKKLIGSHKSGYNNRLPKEHMTYLNQLLEPVLNN